MTALDYLLAVIALLPFVVALVAITVYATREARKGNWGPFQILGLITVGLIWFSATFTLAERLGQ